MSCITQPWVTSAAPMMSRELVGTGTELCSLDMSGCMMLLRLDINRDELVPEDTCKNV